MATVVANTQSGRATINRADIERIVRDVVSRQFGGVNGQRETQSARRQYFRAARASDR